MAVYITLTVVTVFLAWFVRDTVNVQVNSFERKTTRFTRQQMSNLLFVFLIGFFLILVSAGRVAVGNDYWVYRNNFNIIAHNGHVSSEVGFNIVVWILTRLLGEDNYIPIFAFFSIITITIFLKAIWDQAEWFLGTMFLFMTGGFFFSSMNSVRYYLVIAICMYATKYVLRKEYLKFIFLICFAALFHKSVLVVIPLYLIARYFAEHKIPKWIYLLGGLFLVSMALFQDFYRRIVFLFYPYYENSAFDTNDVSFTNIAKCMAVIVLGAVCYKVSLKENETNRFYYLLNVGALFLYTFGFFIPEISRIGYYLIISQIFLIPSILVRIEKKWLRLFFTSGVAVCYIAYFAFFLHTAASVDIRLLPYSSWILEMIRGV